MSSRVLAALMICLALPVWAEEAAPGPHAYFAFRDGLRLSYVTRSTLDQNAALPWEATLLDRRTDAAGVATVRVKESSPRLANGEPLTRITSYLCDRRGIFTPLLASDPPEGTRSLLPLLPAGRDLAEPDYVWGYSGERPLPFGFWLLGLVRRNNRPLPTDGSYHVLNVGPLKTAAGAFAEAVQVTGVERVRMILLTDTPEDVMLRCRRFYVRDVGLVAETIWFCDLPRAGRLTTELTAFAGASPSLLPADSEPARQAGLPAGEQP